MKDNREERSEIWPVGVKIGQLSILGGDSGGIGVDGPSLMVNKEASLRSSCCRHGECWEK